MYNSSLPIINQPVIIYVFYKCIHPLLYCSSPM